jgi:hypothetical protein
VLYQPYKKMNRWQKKGYKSYQNDIINGKAIRLIGFAKGLDCVFYTGISCKHETAIKHIVQKRIGKKFKEENSMLSPGIDHR